jgi:hypothetical protein
MLEHRLSSQAQKQQIDGATARSTLRLHTGPAMIQAEQHACQHLQHTQFLALIAQVQSVLGNVRVREHFLAPFPAEHHPSSGAVACVLCWPCFCG